MQPAAARSRPEPGPAPIAVPPTGTHCLLELYGCPFDRLNDLPQLRADLRAAAEQSGATWLGDLAQAFTPQGVTVLVLLAESHLSIHTWPEAGYAAIDVFTCGDRALPDRACHWLIDRLGARDYRLMHMPRGQLDRPDRRPPEPGDRG